MERKEVENHRPPWEARPHLETQGGKKGGTRKRLLLKKGVRRPFTSSTTILEVGKRRRVSPKDVEADGRRREERDWGSEKESPLDT